MGAVVQANVSQPKQFGERNYTNMKLFYLDNSAWSRITDMMGMQADRYNQVVGTIEQDSERQIVYSEVNVSECIRRSCGDRIRAELSIMGEISNNSLIGEAGDIITQSPAEIEDKRRFSDSIFRQLSESMRTSMPLDQQAQGDSRVKNNYPADKAADLILSEMMANIKKSDPADTELSMSRIKEQLRASIRNVALLNMPVNQDPDTVKRALDEMFGPYLERIFAAATDVSLDFRTAETSEDLLNVFRKVAPDESWLVMVLQSMLAAMRFWPDKKKLMERKGVDVDMGDAGHVRAASHCDFFVTNDKRLRKRYEAARARLGTRTQVISFEEMLLDYGFDADYWSSKDSGTGNEAE